MTASLVDKTQVRKLDGRKLRSDDSRQKIVSAFLHLIRQGKVAPSAEEVAKTANVGLRTVFRRFKEMELLYREMVVELQNNFAPEVVKPWTTTGTENRLQELLQRKSIIYEDIMPYRIAANYHKQHSDFIKHAVEHWIEIERKVLENILPFEREQQYVLFCAIEVALSFETWLQLRVDYHLDPSESLVTMKISLGALLNTMQ